MNSFKHEMSRPCQLRPSSTKRDTVKSLPSQYLLARRTRIESACKMRVVCLRVADLYMSHAPILQKALEIRWHETKFVSMHWVLELQAHHFAVQTYLLCRLPTFSS